MIKSKKGISTGMLAVLVVLGVIVASSAGWIDLGGILGTGDAAPDTTVDDTTVSAFCADPSNTLTVGPMKARWAPATSLSTENARVYVDGIDQGLQSDSSTLTVGHGVPVEIVYAENSSVYHAAKTEFVMPCNPADSATLDGDTAKLITYDTNPTISIFSSDNGNLNTCATSGSNETIAAGETGIFTVKIQGDVEQGWSAGDESQGKACMTLLLNKTAFKEEESVFSGWDKAPTPTFITANNTFISTRTFCKYFEPVESGIDYTGTLKIFAEDSVDPVASEVEASGISGGMLFHFENYYQDTDSGQTEFGIEDNDGNPAFEVAGGGTTPLQVYTRFCVD